VEQSIHRTGRPPRLSRSEEWELYCYRKSDISIKTCAGMFRVSVPTANRIIAKFREYDDVVGPELEELKAKMKAILPQEATPPKPREPRKSSPERREARFWRKVSHAHERGRCWLWNGFTKTSGHGLTSWQSKPIHAHRLAWILKRGEIEKGMCVNHKCRHPTCCNPEHMYLGSRAENMFDRFYRKPMHVTNDSVSEEVETAID
jgi:hypothetical protein